MIKINNKTFRGNNITITDNKVMIDGKDVTPDAKTINIVVEDSIQSIKADVCETITVYGNCNKVDTMSGDVECRDVTGNVKTMSGDVDAHSIGGSVQTMSGDIKYKK